MKPEPANSHLESDILRIAGESISKAVVENLTGYQGPLRKLCENVMARHETTLSTLINDEVTTLLTAKEFRSELKSALNAKLARCLVERMGGEIEKRVNELKANPETRARMTLAIQEICKA